MSRVVFLVAFVLAACSPASLAPPQTPTETPWIAPDFALTAVDGQIYQLSELRGRWVVINFWATWCAPCIEEMPALQQLADSYGDTLVVLGVNMREDEAEIRAFAEQHQVRFPLLRMPADSTLLDYNVIGLPQSFLVTPDGEIVYRSFGVLDLTDIEQFL